MKNLMNALCVLILIAFAAAQNFGVPYISPPLSCPDVDADQLGTCVIEEVCTEDGNGDCGEGKLCCSNGCGILCTNGITPSPLCTAVKAKAENESNGLLGAYIPSCEDDGSFSQIQCHEGLCWCVDTESGKAITDSVQAGVELNCDTTTTPTTTCVNGKVFNSCGTMCPMTCENKDNPPLICPLACKSGCVCPSGTVEYSDGCVLPEDCPTSFNVPYISPPLSCPDVDANQLATCVIEEVCTEEENGDCGEGKLCCSNGCGILCTNGITPSPLCTAVKAKAENESNGLLGAYIPSCEDDGSFSQIQCHEGLCWCVDTESGKAITDSVQAGVELNCNTTTTPTTITECPSGVPVVLCFADPCSVTQCPKYPDATCNADYCGGCNARFYDNNIEITDQCTVSPTTDPTTAPVCTNGMIFSDCGTTCPLTCKNKDNPPGCIAVCVEGCFCPKNLVVLEGGCVLPENCEGTTTTPTMPEYCTLPPVSGMCEAYMPSFFYNATSGMCESFVYGGCGGNYNRFGTYEDCLLKCAGLTIELPSVDTILIQKQVCPATTDSVIGTCSEDCSTDDSCEELEKCCSNGCGHSCMESINIPYYSPPMTCPPIDPAFAIFCNLHFSCQSHDVCDEGELCCPRGCGDSCVTAIKPSPLCPAILNSTLESGLIGAYIPQCETDGTFSSIQCHGSTGMCWCVDTGTGEPTSAPVMHQQPECNDECTGLQCDWPDCGDVQPISDNEHCCPYCPSGCTVGDKFYPSGSSFDSPDGCNTCTCMNGMAACTEMACISMCRAGGIEMYEGEQRNDGCSLCTCHDHKIACTLLDDCTDPKLRSVEITMKFNGDFDTVSQDMDIFKQHVVASLVSRYSSVGLQESQITNVEVVRGSVQLIVTLEDNEETDNANITILLIQMEQDYNNNTLIIIYEEVIMEPSGEFSYTDNEDEDEDEEISCWSYIYVFASVVVGLASIFLLVAVTVMIVMMYKKNRRFARLERVPSSDKCDYEMNVKIKGVHNPTYFKTSEKM